jgi:Integrase core domain
MGIRDRPISPGSPWQNGIAERLIGAVRRDAAGPAGGGRQKKQAGQTATAAAVEFFNF